LTNRGVIARNKFTKQVVARIKTVMMRIERATRINRAFSAIPVVARGIPCSEKKEFHPLNVEFIDFNSVSQSHKRPKKTFLCYFPCYFPCSQEISGKYQGKLLVSGLARIPTDWNHP
jgi:hypothetical protein